MDASRQEAGVVQGRICGLGTRGWGWGGDCFVELWTACRDVVELANINVRSDRELSARERQAHRFGEVAEVRVEHAARVAEDNQLAGLISGDQEACGKLFEHLRKA